MFSLRPMPVIATHADNHDEELDNELSRSAIYAIIKAPPRVMLRRGAHRFIAATEDQIAVIAAFARHVAARNHSVARSRRLPADHDRHSIRLTHRR